MEDTLTLEEMYLLLDTVRKDEHEKNKFLAALQGINLEENNKNDSFEKIKIQAAAELAGKGAQEYELSMIGIEFEPDDD